MKLNKYSTEEAYQDAKAAVGFRPHTSLVGSSVKYDPSIFNFDPKYLYSDLTTGTEANSNVIGVEVIPASHTTNRKARYVSTKNMSRFGVADGSVAKGNSDSNPAAMIPWGVYNENVECLTMYENEPKPLKHEGSSIKWEIDYETENGGHYFACDYDKLYTSEDIPNPIEYPFEIPGLYWSSDEGYDTLLPYPFLPGGERNPLFVQQNSVISDMDGFSSTKKLVNRCDSSINKTGTDLVTTVGDVTDTLRNYPAAVACWRYNAGGLAGQWYLPAIGELVYLWANIAKINRKLAALGSNAVCIGAGDPEKSDWSVNNLGTYLWSSSQRATDYAWYLYTYYGGLNGSGKDSEDDGYRVRAFLQL